MSNYPGELDVFVDKTSADFVAASDPNNAFDAAEAIEGLIGALGKPQSWSETLLNTMRRYRRDMRVYYDGSDVIVKAGEAVLQSSDGNKFCFRRNAGDVTISDANIDGGTLIATFYYVFAQGGTVATTAPISFGTDINGPSGIGTAPFRLIGWFCNQAAGSLAVTFAGSWKDCGDTPNAVFATGADDITTTATYVNMPLMHVDFISSGRPVKITFAAPMNEGGGGALATQLVVDTVVKKTSTVQGGANLPVLAMIPYAECLGSGAHVIDIQWKTGGGGANQEGATEGERTLHVEEL